MSSGLSSGASGLALGAGLYRDVSGLWSGASGLVSGFGGFSPLSLFASSEPGAWYDPSDLTTMFQDSAGTTPVTATGQTVGLVLDKSKGLVLGPRVNLLNYSQEFNNSYWNKAASSVTANTEIAPDGSMTADTANFPTDLARVERTVSGLGTGSYVFSIYLKGTAGETIRVEIGAVSQSVTLTGEWQRVAVTNSGSTSHTVYIIKRTGNTAASVFIWGAQLETGVAATTYQATIDLPTSWLGNHASQSVLASRPILQQDGNGKYYLQFDGSDDWLVSPTITPGIDKAQVFAGVRKLSDAAQGTVLELSASTAANNGALLLAAPDAGATATYGFDSKGTTQVDAVATGFTAPVTSVVSGLADISGDNAIIRVNGVQADAETGDQGTGNYLAYPLYVGRRGGTTLPFNGRIYQMIVRFGANLSAATITQTENWVAGKTGIYTVDQLNRLNARTADGTLYSAYAAADASSNNYLVTNAVRAADGTSYNVI